MGFWNRHKQEDSDAVSWNANVDPAVEKTPKEDPCDKCYNKQHDRCKGKGFNCVAFKPLDAEE